MERIPVSSRAILSIGYDSGSQTLEVEFINGTVYQYYSVPDYTFETFTNAGSKGTFFNDNIKNAYPCSRVV